MMIPILSENLTKIPGLAHGFMTRNGGVSTGVFSSANFGFRGQETQTNIRENRKILLKSFEHKFHKLVLLNQQHTNKVVHVDKKWDETVENDPTFCEADGLITQESGILIGVLTADCLPLLLSTRDGSMVAAVHIGWKGALAGIMENAIALMRKKVGNAEILAATGPCLQQHNFEVSADFPGAFYQKYLTSRGFFLRRENKIYFNLEGFIRFQLQEQGVENIALMNLDTYDQPDQFFSYRRMCHNGETEFGNQVSVIGIVPK